MSTNFPKKLAKLVEFKSVKAGIYEVVALTNEVRIIILSEVPQEKHNAFWYLYSARGNKVAFGANNYQWHTENMSRIINQLFQKYGLEGINVPYTMEDFNRDYIKERISSLTPEERLAGLSANERLAGLPTEEILQEFSANERLAGLPTEEILQEFSANERLAGLPTEEILKHLSVEELKKYLENKKLEQEKD